MQLSSTAHPPILETRHARWPDEAACAASAATLAALPALRDAYVELHGPLGAGKTTFVRHLLHALGVQGRVKSPTYAVMEAYDLPAGSAEDADARVPPLEMRNFEMRNFEIRHFEIRHFDFYRFDDPQEWEDAGFRDVFAAPGLKLAEWPEKAAGFLPVADLRIEIEPVAIGEARSVRYLAGTPRGRTLLAGLA